MSRRHPGCNKAARRLITAANGKERALNRPIDRTFQLSSGGASGGRINVPPPLSFSLSLSLSFSFFSFSQSLALDCVRGMRAKNACRDVTSRRDFVRSRAGEFFPAIRSRGPIRARAERDRTPVTKQRHAESAVLRRRGRRVSALRSNVRGGNLTSFLRADRSIDRSMETTVSEIRSSHDTAATNAVLKPRLGETPFAVRFRNEPPRRSLRNRCGGSEAEKPPLEKPNDRGFVRSRVGVTSRRSGKLKQMKEGERAKGSEKERRRCGRVDGAPRRRGPMVHFLSRPILRTPVDLVCESALRRAHRPDVRD